jgi:hypothetical protein
MKSRTCAITHTGAEAACCAVPVTAQLVGVSVRVPRRKGGKHRQTALACSADEVKEPTCNPLCTTDADGVSVTAATAATGTSS